MLPGNDDDDDDGDDDDDDDDDDDEDDDREIDIQTVVVADWQTCVEIYSVVIIIARVLVMLLGVMASRLGYSLLMEEDKCLCRQTLSSWHLPMAYGLPSPRSLAV